MARSNVDRIDLQMLRNRAPYRVTQRISHVQIPFSIATGHIFIGSYEQHAGHPQECARASWNSSVARRTRASSGEIAHALHARLAARDDDGDSLTAARCT